jgi:hyperosmotically inducible periplasmic protein
MNKRNLFLIAAITATTLFTSCKPKDEEIAKAINTQLSSMTDLKGGNVTVVDGVATVTGECKDDACSQKCKAALEAANVKGVKSISWNSTIAPPPPPPPAPPVAIAPVAAPASVATTMDAKVMQAIKDGMKDIKGVTVDFTAAKPMVVGEVSAATRLKIMQIFSSAKIMPDVSKLTTSK